ncbi:oxidoreductase [Flavobacterium rivuli WB 3.3-2 = DSM 21788]|uniref:Oxidoreductase n=1 Tax=Flavobacterium rivuli WB 3.3-2 = DSM 21788 TaxID=1121895 RepID=A0A0A2MD28_9FLAO|nr:aldo/keto reductase [Flavobacterium rivuli]KGO86165.1 oxidoreductase [Flavobacterium rivuli WB 3.3-2 = DSM 21788]
MQYNTLKRSGLKVSEVSFGCMSLKADVKDNDVIIGKAISEGINLFDTADLYDKGSNEQLLGNALKGKRNDVLISTKVGNRWKEDGSGWDWTPRKNYILKAIDDSLKRLQTDYIDLYLLHGGTIEDPEDEVIEAFERLTDLGKIRAYGISSIRPNVIREYVSRSNIAAVMTQYSLLDRRPEEETLSLLQKNEIGVLARGTVASGLLADKPAKEYLNFTKEEVTAILKEFNANIPEGKTPSVTATRYAIDNPAITTAVVGIRTMQQLKDALAAGNASPLSAIEIENLQLLKSVNFYKEHR